MVLFWLKTSVAASNMRVMYKSPNTLLGVIPLGSSTQTIPLRSIASVDTNTKFNLGSFVWGAVFLVAGLSFLSSSALVGILFLLLAAANLANTMSAQLTSSTSRRQEQRQGVHPRKGQAHAARAEHPAARLR